MLMNDMNMKNMTIWHALSAMLVSGRCVEVWASLAGTLECSVFFLG